MIGDAHSARSRILIRPGRSARYHCAHAIVSGSKQAMNDNISAVVLAGGRARRMGGRDKGLLEVGGQAMVLWVCEALKPQCAAVLVNANRNLDDYATVTGLDVFSDRDAEFSGPLSGMSSALARIDSALMLTCPCDSPLVHPHLAERLLDALEREDAEIAVAHDGNRLQPVFNLLKRELHGSLDAFLASGERKIDRWFDRHRTAIAMFDDSPEMFLNINTPRDCAMFEARLAS